MPNTLSPDDTVDLTPEDGARLHTAAIQLAKEGPPTAADHAEQAAALVTALPTELVRSLHRFARGDSTHNTVLVRGLLSDLHGLTPTPVTTTPSAVGPVADAAALSLLAVLSLLGEPFTFASLYEGRLVQHVTPVPGQEDAQTSEGSDSVLQWHVEDAFTEERCDFFGLLCLRAARDAATLVAPARHLTLPAPVEAVLRAPRFIVEPDLAHGTDVAPTDLPVVAVLSGPPGDPEICFDAIYQRPADPMDSEAAAALKTLAAALDEAAIAHVLAPGQLLIADNRRVVHGRTTFRPRYDGTDRWLLRTMVCASARAHRRRGAIRALV